MKTNLEYIKNLTYSEKEKLAVSTKNSEILDILASDYSDNVQWYVVTNEKTATKTLDRLYRLPDSTVRWAAAKHKNASLDQLERLAKDRVLKVRQAAVHNYKSSMKVLTTAVEYERKRKKPNTVLLTWVYEHRNAKPWLKALCSELLAQKPGGVRI
jgi:hypothetical protein